MVAADEKLAEGGSLMTAWSFVLSELERMRRNEQIARWNENENALAKRLVRQLAQDFAELGTPPKAAEIIQSGDDVAQANKFINWCKQHAVRSCPARPSVCGRLYP